MLFKNRGLSAKWPSRLHMPRQLIPLPRRAGCVRPQKRSTMQTARKKYALSMPRPQAVPRPKVLSGQGLAGSPQQGASPSPRENGIKAGGVSPIAQETRPELGTPGAELSLGVTASPLQWGSLCHRGSGCPRPPCTTGLQSCNEESSVVEQGVEPSGRMPSGL